MQDDANDGVGRFTLFYFYGRAEGMDFWMSTKEFVAHIRRNGYMFRHQKRSSSEVCVLFVCSLFEVFFFTHKRPRHG
jgi:hypothetical protein